MHAKTAATTILSSRFVIVVTVVVFLLCTINSYNNKTTMQLLLFVLATLILSSYVPNIFCTCLAWKPIVVTGGNKGQGLALCQRILQEHEDAYVFMCARDVLKGEAAQENMPSSQRSRCQVVQLDVTNIQSVQNAAQSVQKKLVELKCDDNSLFGVVSNAGILWGYSLEEQFQVNARGVRNFLDAFLPLLSPTYGRAIVVSSGLGPLMHSYASAENQAIMNKDDLKWSDLEQLIETCLKVDAEQGGPEGFEAIGFPGGPFAETAPDFHMYGLAKMMADAYMVTLGKNEAHSNMLINSVDPGLVYTDLILKMPRYEGKSMEESGAQSPHQGVEAAMRVLFSDDVEGSGHFYAMNKDKTRLLKSTIDVKPSED